MVDDIGERLSAAYALGTHESMVRWAATGPRGVHLLREFLDGTWDPAPGPRGSPRDLVDNTSALVAAIAAAQPEAFLEAFGGEQYGSNTLVLAGLGQIDDERATRRLARVAGSADRWVRMGVAMGLGRRPSGIASSVLARLLGDVEFLVRHHALESLARIGDVSALEALRAFKAASPHERDLAERAIRSIEGRAGR
jgi:hypothetical protein